MECYIISDDNYYLLGVEYIADRIDAVRRVICIDIKTGISHFNPASGDVVVLAVTSHRLRRKFMHRPELTWCRLIILVKSPFSKRPFQCNLPCVLAWNTSDDRLIQYLQKMAGTDFRWHTIPSARDTDVLCALSTGCNVSTVSKRTGLSTKLIYRMRSSVFARFGILGCNIATSLMICRDILDMMQNNKNNTKALADREILDF